MTNHEQGDNLSYKSFTDSHVFLSHPLFDVYFAIGYHIGRKKTKTATFEKNVLIFEKKKFSCSLKVVFAFVGKQLMCKLEIETAVMN